MNTRNWMELALLAELLCPVVMLDLPLMTATDAYGTLLWLRGKAQGVAA